jgi:hypothetical protein
LQHRVHGCSTRSLGLCNLDLESSLE